ncbi:MAG: hypothetical protein DRG82_17140, partial [Deltaproteobacteria bacterium]
MLLRKNIPIAALAAVLIYWAFLWAQTEVDMAKLAVTNLRLSGAVISWVTDEKTSSNWVEIRPAGSDSVVVFRDDKSYYVHYIEITDLDPATEYKYRVGSGDTVWDNNGQWYSFKTLEVAMTALPRTIMG